MRLVRDKEPSQQSITHVAMVRRNGGCTCQEGRDAFDRMAFPPRSRFPEVLRSGVVEKVVCPGVFGYSNGMSEVADGSNFVCSLSRMDKGKGYIAVLVPPADAVGVRGFLRGKNFRQGEVNIRVGQKRRGRLCP